MNLCQPHYIEPRTGSHHFDLCGEWELTYKDKEASEPLDLNWNIKTKVPNSIYWSLYEANILPHPYKNCNSREYYWVDEKVWYYRKSFVLSRKQNYGRAFLCFDGASYYTRVWINGHLIGTHEGMFGGPIVQAEKHLNFDGQNEIMVEIKACGFGNKEIFHKRMNRPFIAPWHVTRDNISGNGDFMVLGLWQSVRIEFLPIYHLSRPYLTTQAIENDNANIHLSVEISNEEVNELAGVKNDDRYTWAYANGLTGRKTNKQVALHIEISEKTSGENVFSSKDNINLMDYPGSCIDPKYYEFQFFNKEFQICHPSLWFIHDMGEPFLYMVSLSLWVDGKMIDKLSFDYGIRTLSLEASAGEQYRSRWGKFQFRLNGRNFFLKGMNWMPMDILYRFSRKEYRWMLEMAKNAGIQLLRVWSGGGLPETNDFYEICDELGILVWQDHFIANAETPDWPHDVLESQMVMNLCRIRNHPSLGVHCGGNEFNAYAPGNAASMFVIERNIQDYDPLRPFIRTTPDKGSAHIYRDMEPIWYRHLYGQLPFIAESGIHSFPNYRSIYPLISKDEANMPLPNLQDIKTVREQFPNLLNHIAEYHPDRIPRMQARASQICDLKGITLKELCEASQVAAYEYYQVMIQAVRGNYPVTVGIMPWVFNRNWTTVGIQLVDGTKQPTASYYAVKNAYRPIDAIACLPHLTYAPEENIQFPVKVINEFGQDISSALLYVQILSPQFELVHEEKHYINSESIFQSTSFRLPNNFEETFFFIRIVLMFDEIKISENVYHPKCLNRLRDNEFRIACRTEPQPNFFFDKGPWLKTQIQQGPQSTLDIRLLSKERSDDRVNVAVLVDNVSNVPAYPVIIEVVPEGLLFVANDNFFYLNGREHKKIELEIFNPNGIDSNNISIIFQAWNSQLGIIDI